MAALPRAQRLVVSSWPPRHLPVAAGEVNEACDGCFFPCLLCKDIVRVDGDDAPLLHARHPTRLGPQCGYIVPASPEPVHPRFAAISTVETDTELFVRARCAAGRFVMRIPIMQFLTKG